MVKSLLQVTDLTKHFPVRAGLLGRSVGHVRAVDGVSFALARGETLALVGESGCGKTTTANLILRLEVPTAGRVLVDGKDVHSLHGEALRQYRATVQAVFQDPWSSLNPRMRAGAIIAEPLLVSQRLGRVQAWGRVEELLAQVGLRPEHAGLFPHEFSGGQRQRIALAAALATAPRLIVLDEPVSALDVSIRAQIVNLLRDLQAVHGMAYLLIAHDLATVRHLAHQTAVMYLGQIVESAPTETLFGKPLHPYTRALLAASLPTRPEDQREDAPLEGEVPSPIRPPSGCRFHPRCPVALPRCAKEPPAIKEIIASPSGGLAHHAACHLY